MKQVYLAGPEVFRRDAVARGAQLKALCAQHGLAGLYPLDGEPVEGEGAAGIRARCIAHIDQCQGMVANISPFRGHHMDPGTAWEIGYAQARGLPVFLWSADPRPMAHRIPGTPEAGGPRDGEGHLVEDFGQPENLMIAPPGTLVHASPEAAIAQAAGFLGADEAAAPASRPAVRGLGLGWKIAVALAVSYAVSFAVNKWVGW